MAEERGLMDSNHKVLNVESSIPIQGHSERDTPSDEDTRKIICLGYVMV